jgi:general secretion pathway protein A
VPAERTVKAAIDALNAHLMSAHADGRRVVLIVDEAQTLSPELLEQVRLLTNLETAKQKLLQIILIGQPELRAMLDRPEMRQIAQRITGRYHLEPLRKDETRAYVDHRLRVAGAQSEIFTKSAIRTLYRRSRGIPRLINVIADRALLAAYTQDRRTVEAQLVVAAAAEIFGVRRKTPWWPVVTATGGVAALVFGITNLDQARRPPPTGSEVFLSATPAPQTVAPSVTLEAARLAAPPDPASTATPPVATAPAAPQGASLRALFEQPDFELGADEAIGELLGLWGSRYDRARREPCAQAEEQGLKCYYQRRGTLGELRRIGWPAVLSLAGDDGAEHPVVVAALGYDHATLVANGKKLDLPLAELSFHWYGDHLLLWRPGEAPGRDLAPGFDDEGVRWLRATLAKLAGEPAPQSASTLYDEELEQRVRAYQREHKLTVDGIVGARTQITMLAELRLPNVPLLVKDH